MSCLEGWALMCFIPRAEKPRIIVRLFHLLLQTPAARAECRPASMAWRGCGQPRVAIRMMTTSYPCPRPATLPVRRSVCGHVFVESCAYAYPACATDALTLMCSVVNSSGTTFLLEFLCIQMRWHNLSMDLHWQKSSICM